MVVATDERVALMAIHPAYANAILDGAKHVEFRKRRPAPDIRRVLIYATAPIMRVIGTFDIHRVVESPPADLWEAYGSVGSISKQDFDAYYAQSDIAVAIIISTSERFSDPIELRHLEPRPAIPQSFSYLSWPLALTESN